MEYKIVLEDGKYTVTNCNGTLGFKRYGGPWPAADDFLQSGVVLALAQRIEELETELHKYAQ